MLAARLRNRANFDIDMDKEVFCGINSIVCGKNSTDCWRALMPGPIPFRQFEKLVKQQGCTVVFGKNGKHFKVCGPNGQVISSGSVTHGKNIKGNEVKNIYVRQFMDAIEELR